MFDREVRSVTPRPEQAAVLALARSTTREWYRMAALIETVGSALRVVDGDWTGFEPSELLDPADLGKVNKESLAASEHMIETAEADGVRLVTILDEAYPRNLRRIFNRPPFLWIRGNLDPGDERAVAVVGTRTASHAGVAIAQSLSEQLAQRGVCVLSGLARGIDTAAHRSALDAGGRTIAVMGTGIERVYPAENRELAERIVAEGGALVSQFWPDAPPTKISFPMRNVVMSGMGIGTVVVEASSTSGAKMQARLALAHGKRLLLVRSLVLQEDWARRYAEHPGTRVVDSVDDIIAVLDSAEQRDEQLTLG